ncbi:MAG: Phosphoribosylamine-glycine ligase [Parcubacteria group bacterium GW2011_GWA2_40_37]|nr:MAG: Phosphoribosylamine-glycine ligase [Parcubacteria group bacterium GW2011_GWA2_40_37]
MSPTNKKSEKIKLVIMVHEGGTQTNLKAIREAIEMGKINAEISTVISDKENAMPIIEKINPDYLCLCGWNKIIPDDLIRKYSNKILNLHPGLIPDTIDGNIKNPDGTIALWNKGMYGSKAIQNFLDQKATYASSSIHFLTLDFDFGSVLGRTFEKIEANDIVESLYARLKKKENELYVEVLEKLTSPQPSPERRGSSFPLQGKAGDEVLKILIVGAGGGREHAISWKIAQSPRVGELFFARGNAGTAQLGTNLDIKETEISKLLEFAQKEKIDLTLALSDDPLALGIVDEFKKAGLRIWGPTKAAAQLEWSKAFSKDFMRRHNLPTAKFEIFTEFEKAKKYVASKSLPIVIKASGLALGKGVIIVQTLEEANEALENMLVKKTFGNSGNEIVIEEFLTGPEISIHAFSDGKSYKIFPPSQDHKKIGEGDTGANTGGVGTISPLPFVDEKLMQRIEKEIVAPTLEGIRKDGTPFEGILYPGLILTKEGPKILEYNARFGDPEAQVYMRLMESDLLDIVDACIDKKLEDQEIKWKEHIFACNIVLSSGGYPGNYEKGNPILLEEGGGGGDIVIFHAGTTIKDDKLVTNGGRVLGVSAIGKTLEVALQKAYKAIERISFEEMQYRRDIGKKAFEL